MSQEKRNYWKGVFANAKHGHILWDGTVKNSTDPDLAYTTAISFIDFAKQWGLFKSGNKVLDLGCGNGRFATVFSQQDISYVGIDPCKGSIEFSKSAFSNFKNIEFQFADIWNEVFNPSGSIKSENYKIPYANNYFDDIVVYSVFTHLQTLAAAKNYAKEIRRVLKPGGKMFCSWYRSPPNVVTSTVGRTCYPEHEIITMLSGLQFDHTYGGNTSNFYDQWCLFCTKPQAKFL